MTVPPAGRLFPLWTQSPEQRLLHQTGVSGPWQLHAAIFPPPSSSQLTRSPLLRCMCLLGPPSQQTCCPLTGSHHSGPTRHRKMLAWAPGLLPFSSLLSPYETKDAVRLLVLNSSASGTPTYIFKFLYKQIGFLKSSIFTGSSIIYDCAATLCSLITLTSGSKSVPTVILPLKNRNHMFVLCLLFYIPFIILKATLRPLVLQDA